MNENRIELVWELYNRFHRDIEQQVKLTFQQLAKSEAMAEEGIGSRADYHYAEARKRICGAVELLRDHVLRTADVVAELDRLV